MNPSDISEVLETLVALRTELEALMDQDIHIPSGDLVEQLEGSIRILESFAPVD